MRRHLAAMFLATLLVAVTSACGFPVMKGSAQIGEHKSTAQQIVYDQRLVQIYGEQGAIDKLVQGGADEKQARIRITNAIAASGQAAQ